MASLIYDNFKRAIASGEIDLHTAGDDIRVALLMTNTDADTLATAALMNALALDETAGANYVRKALVNELITQDDGNNRAEFDADDVTWTALGNGARSIQGVIVYKHVTDDTDSIPICFIDFAVDQDPGGSNFTLQWDAQGILQLA